MDIGVVLPQTEIGDDPAVVREFARTAEDLGFDHVLAYDHVLGVHPDREGWRGPYDYRDTFHEPLTLFGHLAGITESIEFVTGILILPQRQTALVAKQAAQVDLLSGGRLRLGVGVGWNEPEYVALGQAFSTRGRREAEQIEVLRALWREELVDFDGEFHTIPEAGINPRPPGGSIPVWLGGMAEPVLRRVARLGDGWLPQFQPGPDAEETLERLREYAREAGRDPDELGIHGRLPVPAGEEEAWAENASRWAALGADYVSVNALGEGFEPREHVDHLRTVADALDL